MWNRFIFQWWKIKISDVELMNYAYGSSGSFGSRVRSKSIEYNTYTGRRSNSCSKPTPIHGLVHKFYLNYSYSISHFSWLPQSFYKEIINRLSQKVSYASMKVDLVMNVFSPNEVDCCLHICDLSIITYVKKEFCWGFSNTSRVNSLDSFRKSVVDKVKLDICILFYRISTW